MVSWCGRRGEISVAYIICLVYVVSVLQVVICELLLYIHKKKDRITEALIEMKKLESELERERLTNLMAVCENQLAREKIKAELKKNLDEERKTFTTDRDIVSS